MVINETVSILLITSVLFLFLTSGKKIKYAPQPKGFVYIPSGTQDRVPIRALWMSETEISNEEYRLFLKDLADSGKIDLHNAAYPDTNLLKQRLWIGAYYGINYFTNAYFRDCPVVGITPVQANAYCDWLTAKYRLKYPNTDYPAFRLPTLIEWKYAAQGGSNRFFPWYGPYLRSRNGSLLANFIYMDDKYMDFDSTGPWQYRSMYHYPDYLSGTAKAIMETDSLKTLHLVKKRKYIFYGMPVWCQSYFPNDYGLYNISGNAAEMVIGGDNKIRCVGGSYATPGAFLRLDLLLDHHTRDSFPLADVGFRVVTDFKKLE